jgi:hypothetical protein
MVPQGTARVDVDGFALFNAWVFAEVMLIDLELGGRWFEQRAQ